MVTGYHMRFEFFTWRTAPPAAPVRDCVNDTDAAACAWRSPYCLGHRVHGGSNNGDVEATLRVIRDRMSTSRRQDVGQAGL